MWTLVGYALLKFALFGLCFVMLVAAVLTWVERKQSALIQDRIGPARANIGPIRLFGLLHLAADGIKSFVKEDFIPDTPNPTIFKLAPLLGFTPAFMMIAVIPFGPGDQMIISNASFGMLFIFAISSLSVYSAALAGWASNSGWAMLGALRGAAQMISYEVSMGLSLIGIFMVYESVNLQQIVVAQGGYFWGVIPAWGIVTQPLAFVLFLTAAIAETKRAPFDMPEGESELVAGYFTEYSAMRFAMFPLSEFIGIVVVAAVISVLFFGGWQIPWVHEIAWLRGSGYLLTALQICAFAAKVIFFCWVQLMLRWTLPRFRYDQLMNLGWKVLLPLSLANVAITGIVLAALHG